MHDVMTNVPNTTIKCLDKGFVELVDVMPRLVSDKRKTADEAIVQAARVSYGLTLKSDTEDEGLIRYLMRHRHSTPFEMVEFKFNCKMPIFVARQWIRHRTANVNEISGRYAVLPNEFYVPEWNEVRQQSSNNKQGSDGQVEMNKALEFVDRTKGNSTNLYKAYLSDIDNGVGKELARMNLPVNIYTQWYWKCDLHNILNFLALRCDAHAQYEIRVFAEAMLELIKPIVPWTIKAWEEYSPLRGGMLLTSKELTKLRHCLYHGRYDIALNSGNTREDAEWLAKLQKIVR